MFSAHNIQKRLSGDSRFASIDLFSISVLKSQQRDYGIGDLMDLKYWLQKLSAAKISFVQFTPIHDTDLEVSPYHPQGLFSLNPVSLSIEMLPNRIGKKYSVSNPSTQAFDYQKHYLAKRKLLLDWFKTDNWHKKQEFRDYLRNLNSSELGFAVFKSLSAKFIKPWWQWPDKFKYLSSKKIAKLFLDDLSVQAEVFIQWQIKMQWRSISQWASRLGIYFILDKPIYPIPDSADVWLHPQLFYLKKDGSPRYVSGVNSPKDPFGQQIWNQAVYKFKEKPQLVSKYFQKNIDYLAKISKVIRLDHVLALVWKYYVIDPETKIGRHLPAIGESLLSNAQKKAFLIAEDLGYNPKIMAQVLDKLQIPRMYCVQFDLLRFKQIDKYPQNSFAFTSNHDLPSLNLWWQGLSKKKQKYYLDNFIIDKSMAKNIQQQLIYQVFKSPAKIASMSVFDLLEQKSQFNIPGKDLSQNWQQRINEDLSLEKINWLKKLVETTNRSNLL